MECSRIISDNSCSYPCCCQHMQTTNWGVMLTSATNTVIEQSLLSALSGQLVTTAHQLTRNPLVVAVTYKSDDCTTFP